VLNADKVSSSVYVDSGSGALTEVPTAHTIKYDLSYDADGNELVYLSAPLATPDDFLTESHWTVTVLALSGGAERSVKDVGAARELALVPHQDAVLVQVADGILSVGLSDGSITTMFASAAPFAVNDAGTEIAVENHVTGAVDRFDISKGMGVPSYVSSRPAPELTSALAYSGNDIIAGGPSGTNNGLTFSVLGGSPRQVASPHPEVLMQVMKIIPLP
jgi:hypothetical protein